MDFLVRRGKVLVVVPNGIMTMNATEFEACLHYAAALGERTAEEGKAKEKPNR